MLSKLFRFLSLSGRLLPVALLLGLSSETSDAQVCVHPCATNEPPAIALTGTQTSVEQQVVSLAAYVSDDDLLYLGTWQLTRNGVAVSLSGADPDYAGNYYRTSGTLSLVTGTNTLIASMCDAASPSLCAADTLTFTYAPVVPPPAQVAPTATLAQPAASRATNDCATCSAGLLTYSTPSVVRNDTPESVSLIYSTEAAKPTGYVEVDAVVTAAAKPHRLSIRLRRVSDGTFVTLTSGGSEAFVQGDTGRIRMAAQFDATGYSTGAYPFDIIVSSHWGSAAPYTRLSDTVSTRILIQNEQGSPYGPGWTVAGLERIHPASGGVVLTDGNGHISWFAQLSCGGSTWSCAYTSPTGDFTTLTRHLRATTPFDTIWTRLDRAGGKRVFLNSGLMQQSLDRYGSAMQLTHSSGPSGTRVATMLNEIAVGAVVQSGQVPFTFAYDATSGKLNRITLPDGRASTFAIHSSDSVIVTDPDTVVAMRVYQGLDSTSVSGRNSARTVIRYDAYRQVSTELSPLVTIDSGSLAQDTTTVISLRAKLLTGQASTVTAAASAAVRADSAYLLLDPQRGAESRVWSHTSGLPLQVISRDGINPAVVKTWSYNANFLPTFVWSTGTGGVELTWSGPLMTEQKNVASGNTTNYWYTTFDQVTIAKVNGVQVLRQFFNGLNLHPDSVLSDSANMTRLIHDAQGRILSVTDSRGATVATAYAPATGNASSITTTASGLASAVSSVQHDAAGRVWKVTDPYGRVRESQYDKLDRLKQSIAPLSSIMTFTYNDPLGQYSVTDALGQVYTERLNARGWVVARIDPRSKVDSFYYDRAGRVVKHKDRRASTHTTFKYDAFGRPIVRVATSGSSVDSTFFGYDPAGLWVSARNGESIDTLFQDPGGRFLSSTTVRAAKTYRMRYSYANVSLLNRIVVTRDSAGIEKWNRELDFEYNVAGSLAYINDYANKGTIIRRGRSEAIDTIAFPTHTTYASRVKQRRSYNAASQIISETFSGTPFVDLSRTYSARDKLGRILTYSRNTSGEPISRSHTYDALARVKTFQSVQDTSWIEITRIPWDPYGDCPGCTVPDTTYHNGQVVEGETYSYDAMGNRTDGFSSGSQILAGNRINLSDGYSISYDDAGNITAKSKSGDNRTYAWNALGQLVQVVSIYGTTTYGYDGWGRRVRKTVNGSVTRYLLDGQRVLIEVNSTHSPVAEYGYYPGVDQPHSMRRGGVMYYYAQDEQGNVIGLVNQSGGVAAKHEYTPYGEDFDGWSSVANTYRFKGREWDAEAGLYYMRARYYEPKLGRFLSEDPMGLAGGKNPTMFAAGDPVNFQDPGGAICSLSVGFRYGFPFDFSFSIHWSGDCNTNSIEFDRELYIIARANPISGWQGGPPSTDHFDPSYHNSGGISVDEKAAAQSSTVLSCAQTGRRMFADGLDELLLGAARPVMAAANAWATGEVAFGMFKLSRVLTIGGVPQTWGAGEGARLFGRAVSSQASRSALFMNPSYIARYAVGGTLRVAGAVGLGLTFGQYLGTLGLCMADPMFYDNYE